MAKAAWKKPARLRLAGGWRLLLGLLVLLFASACGGGGGNAGTGGQQAQAVLVNFAAGPGGTLSGNTTQTVAYGGSTTAVTAVPNTGYTFAGWTGAMGGNPLTVSNVTSNMTVTANFTQQTFTVTFAAGTGGSLTGSTMQTVPYGGATSAVTAVPSPGYTFAGWTGASGGNPLTVSNVTSNMTITANFMQQTFTVTFAAGSGGSLMGSPTQTVAYGGSTTAVTAVPATGYTFAGWTGATGSNPLVVSGVTSNLTITATFTQQTFTVTFAAGSGGSLTGNTTQTVAYGGATSAVTAVPSPGYTFTGWTGASGSNPLVVSGVTSSLTITATFAPQTFTVTFAAGTGGSLTGSTTQTVPYGGSTSAVTAVPSTGYTFAGWTGATGANPLVVSGVTSNLTITATFTQQTFTVTFAAGSGGLLTGTTTQTVAYGGATTAVTAVPNVGYTFAGWTGATGSNPLVVSGVTSNLTITATFTQQTFTVTFAAGTGGSLTGNTTQTVAYGGATSAVTAVPGTGYTFAGWTGATGSNPLVVSGVTSSLTITATFAPQTFTVTFAAGTGGSLTGSTTQTVPYGGSTSAVTAVPSPGYTFTGWTSATGGNPLTVSKVTSNMTITANFTQQTFTVTFATGTGGTLTGSTTQTVAYGDSTTAVTAVPSPGYTFAGWTGATGSNPLVVSGVTSNLTITATFTQQTFTVTFAAGSGGSLMGSPTQTVAYGGSTTAVTAVPATGYTFAGWTGATGANPLVVSGVTSNLTITAGFAPVYALSFSAGAGGTLTGATSQSVVAGADATPVTALPNVGYAFTNWTGTGGFVATTSNPLTVLGVGSAMAITAHFGKLPVLGSFYATATTIGKGQAAYLNWTGLSGYTTAGIDNGGGSLAVANGMVAVYPSATTTYTLTATNAAGSTTAQVTVTVVPPPTGVSLAASPMAVAAGSTVTFSWSATGAASYTLQNLSAGNLTVAGPTTATSVDLAPPTGTTTYRLVANNGYGTTAAATVTVTSGPPVGLTYGTLAATYATGVTIAPNAPSSTAGPITSYACIPAFPAIGLTLNPATGVISGTPMATMARNTYTIQGSNAYGTASVSISIAVVDPPPCVTYPSAAFPLNLGAAVNLLPGNTGGPVVSWSISPALPAGLSFNIGSGAITGTPSGLAPGQTYTVTATNTGGTSSPTFQLSVVQAPPQIAYPKAVCRFFLNQTITPLVPTNAGAPATTWSISPGLPTGLLFDPATGTLSGTPTAPSAAQGYTITATNAGGSGSTTETLSVGVQPPFITVQPYGRILHLGDVASFSVAATGSGPLSYQWCRNGAPIPGATSSLYTAPAFGMTDDGAVLTVVVSDTFSGGTPSLPAVLSLYQDPEDWLLSHPVVAGALQWQVQSGDPFNYYAPPTEAQKVGWSGWTAQQQEDLYQAYDDLVDWFNAGAQPVAMVDGGTATDLTDRPTNQYSQASVDSISTMVQVSPAYMWRLYTRHAAFSILLEASHQVPWSVSGYSADGLRWLFDSSTMAWRLPNGNFGLGTYPGANQPALRNDNRPRTTFTDPRWTYAWLRSSGILAGARLDTIGGFLDYMRQNLYHVNGGADTFGSDFAVWQYRGYSPVSRIVGGTVDGRYPGQGTQHYTEGCHGSTGFLHAALRVVNIPTQPVWVCGHELVYFLSEDLYLDHADDPYNAFVRASTSPSLQLLIDSATWRSRFGNDETVNNWDYSSPVSAYIGYTAVNFK